MGYVLLTFSVGREGNVCNILVVKDIGNGCGEEAARVIALMPKWTPGYDESGPVKVRYTLPVRFSLDRYDEPKKKKKRRLRDQDSLFGN